MLLVTVVTQFTAETTNSEKAVYFLPPMSCSINKSLVCYSPIKILRQFYVFSLTWKNFFGPKNAPPPPPPPPLLSLRPWILIYFWKLFDTIDHYILLVYKVVGFRDDTVNWFHSYLVNRAFLVSIENKYSSISKISCSMAQGSILGTFLFWIYANDVKKVVPWY